MKNRIATLVFLFFAVALQAQTTLRGTVKDKHGEPLTGANVFLKGTYDGISVDAEGNFSFTTQETGAKTLMVTFIGFDSLSKPLILGGSISTLNFDVVLKISAASLGEVVITAGTFEAGSEKKLTVLKSVDIAMTAGANADIVGALNTLPGSTRNGESGQLLVRGGAAYETRTFFDGMFVQNPYSATAASLPARNRFSPFLFKGTSFAAGGYSAEYGQALSSALILNTNDIEGQTQTGFTLFTVGVGASHQHRFKKSSVAVTANYNNLKPYFLLMKQKVDFVKTPQNGNVEVNIKNKIGENGIWKIYANVSKSQMGVNYATNGNETEKTPLLLGGNNLYLNTSYRNIIFKDWTLFVGAAYTNNKDVLKQNFNLTTQEQSAQVRATLTKEFSTVLKLKTGVEYLHNDFDENISKSDAQNTLLRYQTKRIENYVAAFSEADLRITDHWVARIGVRGENSKLLSRSNVAPRISAAYLLGKTSQIAAAFGQFYQTPENTVLRTTTDLNFEKSNHYMINYMKVSEGYTFRAETYYKTYQDLVKTNTILPNNSGSGYARGIDLFFRDTKSIRNGDYYVSYSWLDTKRDARNFPTLARPTFAAKHNFNVVYKHWISAWSTLVGATYSFQSGRPFNDPNTTDFNGGRTPQYHDLSMNLVYLTNIKGNFTAVWASVTNVLGNEQVFGYRYNSVRDSDGKFGATPVTPPAKRMIIVGLIYTIGQKFTKNKNNNDDL